MSRAAHKTKLTKRLLDGLKPEAQPYSVYDSELPGFFAVVYKTGNISFRIRYLTGHGRGAPRVTETVGEFGAITVEGARVEAKKLLAKAAVGESRALERKREKLSQSLKIVAARFLEEHVDARLKAKTATDYRDIVNRILVPTLGHLKCADVTKQDVLQLHHSLRGTPTQANRAVAVGSSLYRFAADFGLVDESAINPFKVRKFKEQSRDRFLSTEELARLGKMLAMGETVGLPWDDAENASKHLPPFELRRTKLDPYATAAIRLNLFVGARLREILHAKWEYVDFERGMIFLPNSKTGRKPLFLPAPALAILSALPRVSGNPYIFAGLKEGAPRVDLKRPWGQVTKAAGLEGVRLHDLRHTFAAHGAGRGFGLPVIGALLGHSQAQTTQRYSHVANDPLRRAVESIGGDLSNALDGASKDVAQVRAIKRG